MYKNAIRNTIKKRRKKRKLFIGKQAMYVQILFVPAVAYSSREKDERNEREKESERNEQNWKLSLSLSLSASTFFIL